jgi:murein DD-endopeptidase MepM/ murein hydrolase activator NlpD
MRRPARTFVLVCVASVLLTLAIPGPARAAGTWTWPVIGPVIRGFDPPDTPFGSGHRGIDIAAPVGTPVRAAASGVVTFAGPVGGRLFVTIDHGGGLESRYSFLETVLVRLHDLVSEGQVIARSGTGHTGDLVPNLHLAVLLRDMYVDPLDYLGPIEVWRFIRLAPLNG